MIKKPMFVGLDVHHLCIRYSADVRSAYIRGEKDVTARDISSRLLPSPHYQHIHMIIGSHLVKMAAGGPKGGGGACLPY